MYSAQNPTSSPFGVLSRFGTERAFGSTATGKFPTTKALGATTGTAFGATGVNKKSDYSTRYRYPARPSLGETFAMGTGVTFGGPGYFAAAANARKAASSAVKATGATGSQGAHGFFADANAQKTATTRTAVSSEVKAAGATGSIATAAQKSANVKNTVSIKVSDVKTAHGAPVDRTTPTVSSTTTTASSNIQKNFGAEGSRKKMTTSQSTNTVPKMRPSDARKLEKKMKKLDSHMDDLRLSLVQGCQLMSTLGELRDIDAPLEMFQKNKIKETVQKLRISKDLEWEALRIRAYEVLKRIADMEGSEPPVHPSSQDGRGRRMTSSGNRMEEEREGLAMWTRMTTMKRRAVEEPLPPMPIKRQPMIKKEISVITLD